MTQPESHQFGGVLREFADDWTPIFADLEREYSHLTEIVSCRPTDSGAKLEARTDSGQTVWASIALVTPEVFRLRHAAKSSTRSKASQSRRAWQL